ncbi:MAG TPA: AMP-dependent synthetase/ligase [Mycobacteriales bacterium]|jgi:long-chain acyl-CoA synthetase|nr:AMP-dependent synthetase/ligase [Mycobacteriales bacterium]
MKEYASPIAVAEPTSGNLTDYLWTNERDFPDSVVFSRRGSGGWSDVTSRQFAEEVRALAAGFVASGVQVGDRVGLMSRTRYEWAVADFAIWTAGGITVPIYETSSAEQVEWILSDSGAVAVIVENDGHAETVASVAGKLSDLRHTWAIDRGDLDKLVEQGKGVARADLDARHGALTPETLATIIYTSGTTGRPKGCELTHGNFMFDVSSTTEGLNEFYNEAGSTLLFLPLAHVFGRIIQLGSVANRVRVGHTADVKNLLPDLAAFQPTFLLSVPRVFEKVYNASRQKAHADGKGKIFDAAERVAIAYSEALDKGGAGLGLKVQHKVFDKLVFSKLRAALGGKVEYCVSGGAPLGARLGHFFRGIGVTILEGYGLTETSAGSTLNLPGQMKVGTVGRAIPGTTVRIAEDGEILLKGAQIFTGYYKNAKATAEAIDPDGWFHTGDIGTLDADGFLTITGRKKELIVTAGGKNVAPAVLEDRLRAHPLVSQCIVVGDNKPFIGCLVTIDPEAFPAWKSEHGKPEGASVADLADDPDLRAEVQGAVDQANKAVSKAEAIKSFRILPVDFTEESGHMTPSLKVKRAVVLNDFAREVEAIYAS